VKSTLASEVLQDEIAISLAQAVAIANQKAQSLGVVVRESLISITQKAEKGSSVWRINYGPRDYVNMRGGDLVIEVDIDETHIKKVYHGQ